jgi:hypothetical protein
VSGARKHDLDDIELLAANLGEKDAATSLCKTYGLGTRLANVFGDG